MRQSTPEDLALRLQSLALSPNFDEKEIDTVTKGAGAIRYLKINLDMAEKKIGELEEILAKERETNGALIKSLKHYIQSLLKAYDAIKEGVILLASIREDYVEEIRKIMEE